MANKIHYFRVLLISFGILLGHNVWAQSEHKSLLDGTEAYQKGDYETASKNFEAAVEQNRQSVKGNYNLGNAYYKRKQFDEATTYYQDAVTNSTDDMLKSKAYYNLGNTYLSQAKSGMTQQGNMTPQLGEKGQEQLKNAIDAYKNALRHNVGDYDAKNNLGMAYKMLRRQQQQQQQQQQQNQQENQENQENQDQQNQQNQQEKESDKDQNGQQSPPEKEDENKDIKNQNNVNNGKPQDMEQKQIERMLKRIEEEDKKVQEKLMKRKRSENTRIEKDW